MPYQVTVLPVYNDLNPLSALFDYLFCSVTRVK